MWDKQRIKEGIRIALPVCIGVLPVGISYGLLARQSGLSFWQTVAMSVFVLAGSAQIMACGMLVQGAAFPMIILAVFFLNLRHTIMSSSIFSRMKDIKLFDKVLLAYAVTDESFALFSLNSDRKDDQSFLFGINFIIASTWFFATFIGALAQAALPPIVTKSMGIALYAAFAAILVPKLSLSRSLVLVVLITMGFNSVFSLIMPRGIALVVSMLSGAGAGVFLVPDREMEVL